MTVENHQGYNLPLHLSWPLTKRYVKVPRKCHDYEAKPSRGIKGKSDEDITKTCLYNIDPLKPHFYIVKLGFTGVYIIFLFLLKNIDCGYTLEPPRRGGSNEYPQFMFWAEIWKISEFFIWFFLSFWRWNFIYIWIGMFSLWQIGNLLELCLYLRRGEFCFLFWKFQRDSCQTSTKNWLSDQQRRHIWNHWLTNDERITSTEGPPWNGANTDRWTGAQHFMQAWMCAHRRHRSACPST